MGNKSAFLEISEDEAKQDRLHPASADAGTWTRSMALATAYKERLVLLGRQGRKRVAGIVQPVTSRVCSIVCQRAFSRQTNSFCKQLVCLQVSNFYGEVYEVVTTVFGSSKELTEQGRK